MDNIVKDELIEWIAKPENEDLLQTLKLIKESFEEEDWFDKLSNHEKKSIKKGQEDHQKGRTMTSKAFWEKHA